MYLDPLEVHAADLHTGQSLGLGPGSLELGLGHGEVHDLLHDAAGHDPVPLQHLHQLLHAVRHGPTLRVQQQLRLVRRLVHLDTAKLFRKYF